MNMNFIQVKVALQNLLIDNANGNFQVVGAQRQEKSGEEFVGSDRMVEIYFKKSSFPRSKGAFLGPVSSDVEFSIEFTVSAPALVDLSVLENPSSTTEQIQTALSSMKAASSEADDRMDELISMVWQILMNPINEKLGLRGIVSNRWVDDAIKNDPNPRGSLVVLTGAMPYSCNVCEVPPGELGVDSQGISLDNIINNDQNQRTGIEINT